MNKANRTRFFSSALSATAFLALAASALAGEVQNPIFGLAEPARTVAVTETVGTLPYSSQWISETIGTYVYLNANTAQLAQPSMSVGKYSVDFGSNGFVFLAVDLFSRFFAFADPESSSVARHFSLWGRYGLGGTSRSGRLSSSREGNLGEIERDSLLYVSGRAGLLLGFDRWSWVRPYVGMELDPYFFRNASDISGAEQQGEALCYGPVAGLHLPVLFGGRGSLLTEYRKTVAIRDPAQILRDGDNFTAGLGLTF